MLITLLVFILVLGLMVFVHELGHFLVAKKNGVRVDEFAFGFRPRLLSKKVGETTYALNLIPLGGYVRMAGESDDEIGPRSYKTKRPMQKIAILVAGSTMNVLLAWLLLTILFVTGFEPFIPGTANNPFLSQKPVVSVGQVQSDSPAFVAGFQTGDQLLSVNKQPIGIDQEFVSRVQGAKGQPIVVEVLRDGQVQVIGVTPRLNPPEGQGAIGVSLVTSGKARSSILSAPIASIYEVGRVVGLSVAGFFDFVGKLVFNQRVSEDVTGIVGVGALTGVARRLGVDYLIQLMAIISTGLAVVNLMPILPLDGGHIAVVSYESLTKRKLTDRQFGVFASLGLAFILVLFAVVTFKDFIRFDVLGRIF